MIKRVTILFIFYYSAVLFSQTVYVPANNRIYDFIERMEVKRVLPFALDTTRPLTRLDIAEYIKQIHANKHALGRVDLDELEFYISEFREELPELYSPQTTRIDRLTRSKYVDPFLFNLIYANGRNFLSVQNGPIKLYWDPVFHRERMFAQADTLEHNERVFKDTNGFVVWGVVGEHLGFFSDIRDTKEWGTRVYPWVVNTTAPHLGFAQGGGDYLYHDETRAHVAYNNGFLLLQYGKDYNQWGPGYRGQLALSDNATSYDLVKLQIHSPRIKYTMMWGVLEHFTIDYFYGNHQEKYLSAHRLEFAPWNSVSFGMNEVIIYAGRKWEPAYFNPVMFLRSAEHYLGDRDNAAMGLDFKLKIIPRTLLYGELFLDDITTSKLGTGFYGNKYAWLTGIHTLDLFGLRDTDLRVEYARIRPYTYTHKSELTRYMHFTSGLGHWIGPNSDDLYFELEHRFSHQMWTKIHYEYLRHGDNSSTILYGGSLFEDRGFADPEYIEFLDGLLSKSSSIGLFIGYELVRGLNLSMNYTYSFTRSEKYSDRNMPGKRSEFLMQLSLNY